MPRWCWILLLSSCAAAHTGPVDLVAEPREPEDLRPQAEGTSDTPQVIGQSPHLASTSNPLLATCLAASTGPGDYVVVIDRAQKSVRPKPDDNEAFVRCLEVAEVSGALVMSLRIQADGYGRVPRAVGGLSENEVREVIANSSFARCVLESMKRSSPNGAALLSFDVNSDGTTHGVRLVGSHFQDALFEACLVEVIKSTSFPAHPQPTRVMFPLQFSVGQ